MPEQEPITNCHNVYMNSPKNCHYYSFSPDFWGLVVNISIPCNYCPQYYLTPISALNDLLGEQLANFLDPNYVTDDKNEPDEGDEVGISLC